MQKEIISIIEESDAKMIENVKKQIDELSNIVGETIDTEAGQEKRKAVIEGKRQALEFYKELTQWLREKLGVPKQEEDAGSFVEKKLSGKK